MQEKQPSSKGLQGCLNHVDNQVAGAKPFHSKEAITEALADVDHAVPHMKLAPKKHFLSKSSKITEKVDSLLTNKSASENTAEELPPEFFEKSNKSTMKVINMRSCIEAIVLSELQKSDSLPSEECSILQVLSMCSGSKGNDSNPGGLSKSSTYSKKENLVQPKFVSSCDRNNLSSVSWSQEKCLAECIPDRGVLETQGNPSSGPSGRFDMSTQNIKGNVPNFNQQSARIGADIAAPQDVRYGRWVEQQNVEPSFQLASNLLVKRHSQRKPERNPVLRRSEVSEQSQMHSSIYWLRGSESHEESTNFLKDSYCDSSVRDGYVKTRSLNPDNRFCSPGGFSDSMVIPQSRCPDAVTDGCHRNLHLPCENSLGTYGFTRADISNSIQPPPLMSVNSRATDMIPKQAARKGNLLSSPFLTNLQNVDFEKKEGKEVQEISTFLGFAERKNSSVGPLHSASYESGDITAMQEVQVINEVPLDLSVKVESGLYAEDPSQRCYTEVSGCLKSPGIRYEITCKRSIGYEQNVGRADQCQQEDRRNDGYFPQVQKQVNSQCLTSRQPEYYVGDITKISSNQHEFKSMSNSYKSEVGGLAEYQQTTARQRCYQHPAGRLTGYQNEDLREDGYQTEAFKCLPYQNESGEQKQKSFGNGRRETGWLGMRQQSSSVTVSSLETMQMNAWRSDRDYQAAFDQSGSTPAMLLPISSADIQKSSQGRNNKNSSMSLLTPYDHYSPSSYETGEIPWDGKGLHGVSMQGNVYHPTIMLRSDPSYIDPKCLLMTSEHKASNRGAFEFGEEMSRPKTHLSGYSPLLPSTCLASPIIPQLSPNVAPGAENRTTSQVAPSIRTTASTLLGSHSPNDILHLQCKLCSSTHGSLRSFRIHFAKVHGQEPLPQHCTVLTISEARSVLARYSKQEMGLSHLAEELYYKSGNEWTETISGNSMSGLHTSQQKSSLDRSKSLLAVARTKQIAEVYPMPARPSSVSREAKSEPSAAPVKMVLDNINSSEFSKDTSQSAGHVRSCSDLDGLRGGDLPVYGDKESDNLKSFCSLCRESYENIEDWKFHVTSVHLMFPCKCKTCKISFVHVTALRKHISVVHCNAPEVVVEYYCLFCWGHFTTEDALYLHVSNEHKEAISEASQGRRSHTVVVSKDCDSFTECSQADTTSLEGASDGYENLSTSKRTISNAEVKIYNADESNMSICADQSKHPALERKQNGDVMPKSSTTVEMKVPQKEVENVEYVTGSCLCKADSQLMNLETVDGCPLGAENQQRNAAYAADLTEANEKEEAKEEIDRYRNLSHVAVGFETESKPFLLSKKASLLRRFQNDKNSSCLEKTTPEEKADTCGYDDALKSKYYSLTEVAADDVSTSDKSKHENATSGQHHTLRHFLDALLIAEVRRASNSPPSTAASSNTLLQRLVSSKFFPTNSVVHALGTDCGPDMNDNDRASIPLSSSFSTTLQVSLQESAEEVLDRQVSKVTPSKMSASSQNESRFLSNRQSELAENTFEPDSVSAGVEHLPKTSLYIHNPEAFSDFIFSPGVLPSDKKSNQNLSDQLRPSKVASSIALELRVNAQDLSGVDSHLECKASNLTANNLYSEHQNFSAEGAHAENLDATDQLLSFNVSESLKSCDYWLNTEEDRKQNVKRGTVECLNMLPNSCQDRPKNCDTNTSKVQTIDKNKGCGKGSDLVVSMSLGSFPVESSLKSNADEIDLVESIISTETTSRVLSVPARTEGQHGTSVVGTLQLGSTDISQSQSPHSSGTPHSLKRKYLTSDREFLGDDACDIEMNAKKPLW